MLLISLLNWTCGKRSLKLEGKVLLITAHPDDECMFFAPTIISLTQNDVEVFLLCLSEGPLFSVFTHNDFGNIPIINYYVHMYN